MTHPVDYRMLAATATTLRRAFLRGDTLVVQDLAVVTEMVYPTEQIGLFWTRW